jgi:ABC-type tungstate transport system substrate-binding protein
MSLVPVIMRMCAKLTGAVSLSQVELFTQNSYFVFQLIQVFLIQTLTNTASTSLISIVNNPSSVFSILATSIPTSSNFYISYFIVQGITIGVSVLTQVVGLFVFQLIYKFLAGTPRAMYNKWTTLSAIMWGSVLPVYTTIVVISKLPALRCFEISIY